METEGTSPITDLGDNVLDKIKAAVGGVAEGLPYVVACFPLIHSHLLNI